MKKKLVLVVIGIALASALVFTTCELSVGDPVRYVPIVKPYISEQPRSYSYLTSTYEMLTTVQEGYAEAFLPHVLEVNVEDWNGYDGALSYQWYTFTDIDEYCKMVDAKDEDGNLIYEKDSEGKDTTTVLKVLQKGEKIEGATSKTFTPVIEDPTKTGDYYYYCEITNYFRFSMVYEEGEEYGEGQQGPTRSTIQSALAVISIFENTVTGYGSTVRDALYAPNITRQPVSAEYPMGRSVLAAPLTVEAEPPLYIGNSETPANLRLASGSVGYKWYTNTTFSTKNGTPIPGGNQSTYTPDLSTLNKGDNYFYVEVTYATTSNMTKTIACLPVTVTMVPSTHAATPKITSQPRDQVVFTGDEIDPLTVAAVSPDGGPTNLSYQWYKLDKAVTANAADVIVWETWKKDENGELVLEDGKPVRDIDNRISGATNANYTPTVDTGSAYFGVKVTNTNPDATVQSETVLDSKIVTVTRMASYTGSAANATITVPNDYNTVGSPSRMQYIRGYGAMDVAWANFPQTKIEDTELQYNPDWGMGFNILRIMVVPPGSTAGNFTSHADLIINGDPASPGRPNTSSPGGGLIHKHRPDYINNVKIVNKYNGYVLASPWTPPKEWKTNNSINSGGDLIEQYYPAFAGYLREFAQFMYYQGAPIYAISIANEPNYAGGYDGCEWKPGQMRDFWLRAGRFTEGVRGWGGGKSIPTVKTMNGESANDPNINFDTLNNAVSRGAVDLYARHVYGAQTNTLWRNQYADFKEGPNEKECWMTEHNINSATPTAFVNDSTWKYVWRFMNDVDLVMRINNENAFVWWAGKRFYSFVGDGATATAADGSGLPRGWGLSHYAKYTIDTRRIALKGDAIKGTLKDGTAIVNGSDQVAIGDDPADKEYIAYQDVNVNPCNFGMDTTGAKITAYVSQDGNEISFVMFTPTLTDSSGGYDMGTIEIKMPTGFEIGSVKAQKSVGDNVGDIMQPYEVAIASDRKSAFVDLSDGEILSVKFTKK